MPQLFPLAAATTVTAIVFVRPPTRLQRQESVRDTLIVNRMRLSPLSLLLLLCMGEKLSAIVAARKGGGCCGGGQQLMVAAVARLEADSS